MVNLKFYVTFQLPARSNQDHVTSFQFPALPFFFVCFLFNRLAHTGASGQELSEKCAGGLGSRKKEKGLPLEEWPRGVPGVAG